MSPTKLSGPVVVLHSFSADSRASEGVEFASIQRHFRHEYILQSGVDIHSIRSGSVGIRLESSLNSSRPGLHVACTPKIHKFSEFGEMRRVITTCKLSDRSRAATLAIRLRLTAQNDTIAPRGVCLGDYVTTTRKIKAILRTPLLLSFWMEAIFT